MVTGEAVALNIRPASYVLRAAGLIIDVVTTVLVLIGAMIAVSAVLIRFDADEAAGQAAIIVTLVLCLVGLPTLVETLSRGKSLGKWATGVRVVRDDGGAIQFRHALIRALVGFFEIYATGGGGAALTGLLSSRTKRLGDMVAGTYAQHERVPQPVPQPPFMPPELAAWASIADVARMPDSLSRRIGQFLSNYSRMQPRSQAAVAADLASEAAPFVSPLPGGDPVRFLLAITALRRERERAALESERRRLERLEPTLRG
nr:RDD family protein [Lysinibacter cavernae]